MRLERPRTLDEALGRLADGRYEVLAGGTDVYPGHVERPFSHPLLDITGLEELCGITCDDKGWTFGALTTWTDVVRAELPPAFDALRAAGREVGSVQIQNAATVAGNLCNASPAADGVPALAVLDVEVELRSIGAVRRLPLRDFLQGNRQTARRPDELMTRIFVPAAAGQGRSAFVKLGARRYLVISIVMVAARLAADEGGTISDAAVSVGACSAVAERLPALEQALRGRRLADGFEGMVHPDHLQPLAPIDDIRGGAAYRLVAARQAVIDALDRAGGLA